MRSHFAVSLTALTLLACGAEQPPTEPRDGPAPREQARKVDLRVRVEHLDRRTASLRRLTAEHHGYVCSANVDGSAAQLSLRVPADDLPAFRRAVRRLGDVEHESEELEDVTAQHADTSARLRNARHEEERLLALVDQRTGSLADVLTVEEHLSRVRERIEQLEAQESATRHRVEMAIVRIDLFERELFWERPGETLAESARVGLHAVAAVAVGAAAVAASLGPPALFGLLLLATFVSVLRRLFLRSRRRSTHVAG